MSRLHPSLILVTLACAFVVLLAACGGDEDVAFVQNDQAQIVCSDTCATHGQCGTLTTDDRRAVLGNENGPAVTLHDRFFVEGTTVTIVEPNPRELIAARDGAPLIGVATPFPHIFYRVNGEGKTAWVSEWCLARP